MKIALLLDPVSESNPAGLGRSVFNFAKSLISKRSGDSFVVITRHKTDVKKLFPDAENIEESLDLDGNSVWSTGRLWRRSDFDLLISFTPIVPIFYFGRTVVFAHDFAFLKFAKPLQRVLLWLLNFISFAKSELICVVSEESKRIACKAFFLKKEKVEVVYNGFDHFDAVIEAENFNAVRKKQFLSVGVIKERKNTLATVRAFEKFFVKHPEFKLIVVGNNNTPYGKEVVSYVENSGLSNNVAFKGFVSDHELSELYKNSCALVFPSLVEGFGFPILEAMANGLPVITSQDSALSEVAGGAAILVDPGSPESISAGMESVLNETVREKLIDAGRRNIKRFTWRDASLKLSNNIDNLMNV